MPQRRSDRKEQILQSLAAMLESSPGSKITTAKLAASLDVSEAALYRHFPSKTRMYESLIDFVEETLLSAVQEAAAKAKATNEEAMGAITGGMPGFPGF